MSNTKTFKTEKEIYNYLLNEGDLWYNGSRLNFIDGNFIIEAFRLNERIEYIVNKPLHTSEPFNTETCPDKAVVMCWDDNDKAWRVFRFWDKVNNATYTPSGRRCGFAYDHYQLIPDDQAPWMIPLRNNLED